MAENYEVQNAEVQATLRSIAGKIKPALAAGWGFLLMIFEYGTPENPGANFYISSADRGDVVTMLREWIKRNSVGLPKTGAETVEDLRGQWLKIVALLLSRYAPDGTTLTMDDFNRFPKGNDMSVAIGESVDGLHLSLVDGETARQLAAQEQG